MALKDLVNILTQLADQMSINWCSWYESYIILDLEIGTMERWKI